MSKRVTTRHVLDLLSVETGSDPESLVRYARALAADGLYPLSKGGRNGAGASVVSLRETFNLLIALLSAPGPAKAAEAVRIFADLPLSAVRWIEHSSDGSVSEIEVPPDSLGGAAIYAGLGSLGEALERCVYDLSLPDANAARALILRLSGWSGTCYASMSVELSPGGPCVTLVYSTDRLGGGRRPDDAAPCRIDRSSFIPGRIFEVLVNLYGTKAEEDIYPIDALVAIDDMRAAAGQVTPPRNGNRITGSAIADHSE